MSQPEPTPAKISPTASRHVLQQRVSAAILEAAARALATYGEQASMNDVAEAAGVARATVYRYFPNRQALLEALARVATNEAAGRLEAARLADVDVNEAVRRAVRSLVEVGDYFSVLVREPVRPNPQEFEHGVIGPLNRLFERGRSSGAIRDDVPSSWLTGSLIGLVGTVLSSIPALGREDTIAAISGMFLDGARARPRAS
jgi:TetR/AcrR family transcriptional regulator, mexCD-oprJ operon repressor